MLPHRMKSVIFDSVSKMPIRYVRPIPFSEAKGLVADVYGQVADEFFINGAITTHSVRPPLLAGMWCGGREIVMVDGVFERPVELRGVGPFAQHDRLIAMAQNFNFLDADLLNFASDGDAIMGAGLNIDNTPRGDGGVPLPVAQTYRVHAFINCGFE